MKKVLTVLLAIAVVFTFSFGSTVAFADTDEVKDTVNALKDASVSIQGTIDSDADAYKKALQIDDDGYVIAAKGDISSVTTDDVKISKAIMEARVNKVAEDAKNAFDAEVKKVQNKVEKGETITGLSLTASSAKAFVNSMFAGGNGAEGTAVQFHSVDFNSIFTDSITVLKAKDYTAGTPEVIVNQYKADKDAAADLIAAYKADVDKYSDNTSDKEYKPTDELVDANVGDKHAGTLYKIQTNGDLDTTGVVDSKYLVSDLTGEGTAIMSTKQFVKNFMDYQAKVLDAIDVAGTKETLDGIKYVKAVKAVVEDVMKGHKADAKGENYYVEAVPTKEETTGEGLTTDKNRAIREIKAQLNAAVVTIETALDDALTEENKKSKPDNAVVRNLRDALNDLNAQTTAMEEYITTVINYAKSSNEVKNVKGALLDNGEVGSGADAYKVLSIKPIKDFNKAASNIYNEFSKDGGAQGVLKAAKKIGENVVELKKEADLVKAQLEVNGQGYYDPAILADNLDDATKSLYQAKPTGGFSTSQVAQMLRDAKEMLYDGNEITLVLNKWRYTEYIKGDEVSGWKPDDKNGNELNDKNEAGKFAWNKADATRKVEAAGEKIAVMKDHYVNKAKTAEYTVDLYDEAQADALKALVSETEKAIKAAKSVAEVKAIFVAAQAKYEDITTTKDHIADWAKSKPIGKEYDKQGYDDQLSAYYDYVNAKVDFTDDYYLGSDKDAAKAKVLSDARDVMFKAYSKDELAAKFDEAKAMIDKVPTKTEVKNAKKAVEDAINALPTTVALTDKDAIVKAADALDDYKDMTTLNAPSINNETKLVAAKTNYEKVAADELTDAYRALKNKTITIDDEAAVEALRALYDAYEDFYKDYCVDDNIKSTVGEGFWTGTALTDANVEKLEDDLSDAKVFRAKELMIKIPANPALANKADVEAARAYYDSLELKEQLQVVGTQAYKAFLDAEEALGLNTNLSVKELKITASSTAKKGSITVKWTVKGDAAAVDGYEIWKSKKHSSGYKKAFTTKKQTYKNTKGLKKGTRYYYKVRAYKMVDGKKITSDWSNKARRVAK